VRIWRFNPFQPDMDAAPALTFNGHKSAVTTLAFDDDGLRLATGSQDTDIIVWDVVAETGLFR
jgi:U3 small nucleolar RNA-associated protein 12